MGRGEGAKKREAEQRDAAETGRGEEDWPSAEEKDEECGRTAALRAAGRMSLEQLSGSLAMLPIGNARTRCQTVL
jgi:hypothetical protein